MNSDDLGRLKLTYEERFYRELKVNTHMLLQLPSTTSRSPYDSAKRWATQESIEHIRPKATVFALCICVRLE